MRVCSRCAARPVARTCSITKRMGLVSSKDCIWTEFTSQTLTKDYSIVPSSISRNSSAPNAGSISGFPLYTRKNNDWPFGFLKVLSRKRSASATKKTHRAVMVVHSDANIIHGWSPRAWCMLPSFPLASFQAPDRKSTRLNSSHIQKSRMPSSA